MVCPNSLGCGESLWDSRGVGLACGGKWDACWERLGVETEVKGGPVVSRSLSSVTVQMHWYAMGGVPAVAQVFLLAYDTITNLHIRRCEPWWSASPETIRDYGP